MAFVAGVLIEIYGTYIKTTYKEEELVDGDMWYIETRKKSFIETDPACSIGRGHVGGDMWYIS